MLVSNRSIPTCCNIEPKYRQRIGLLVVAIVVALAIAFFVTQWSNWSQPQRITGVVLLPTFTLGALTWLFWPQKKYCLPHQRVFPLSNENIKIETLRKRLSTKSNTWVGVSGLFNLNGALARDLENIVVLDRSDKVIHFWKEVKEIVLSSENKEVAKRTIRNLIKRNQYNYFYQEADFRSCLNRFDQEILSGESWLATNYSFAKVKAMFLNDKIHVMQMDLSSNSDIRSLTEFLFSHGLMIDTLYISNVLDWLHNAEKVEACLYNFAKLMKENENCHILYTTNRAGLNEFYESNLSSLVQHSLDLIDSWKNDVGMEYSAFTAASIAKSFSREYAAQEFGRDEKQPHLPNLNSSAARISQWEPPQPLSSSIELTPVVATLPGAADKRDLE